MLIKQFSVGNPMKRFWKTNAIRIVLQIRACETLLMATATQKNSLPNISFRKTKRTNVKEWKLFVSLPPHKSVEHVSFKQKRWGACSVGIKMQYDAFHTVEMHFFSAFSLIFYPMGRPWHTWIRSIEDDRRPFNLSLFSAWRNAQDRQKWRDLVAKATSSRLQMMISRLSPPSKNRLFRKKHQKWIFIKDRCSKLSSFRIPTSFLKKDQVFIRLSK